MSRPLPTQPFHCLFKLRSSHKAPANVRAQLALLALLTWSSALGSVSYSPAPNCPFFGPGMIRSPIAADKYYAGAPLTLLSQLSDCLTDPAPRLQLPTAPMASRVNQGRLRGLIVPHGAYQDSGKVAAQAYSLLASHLSAPSNQSGARQPLRAILLGTNHFILQPAACLSLASAWATPLGNIPVDPELNDELHGGGIPYDDAPHRVEHSIENQLPFLQYITSYNATTPSGNTAAGAPAVSSCSIAPINLGWLSGPEEVERVAGMIAAVIISHPPGNVVLIATSDFTHAGPSYREAPAAPWMSLREHAIWRDSPLLHSIIAGDPENFLETVQLAGTSLCGRWPVAVFLRVAQALQWDTQLLSYAPSNMYVQSRDINGFASFAAWELR